MKENAMARDGGNPRNPTGHRPGGMTRREAVKIGMRTVVGMAVAGTGALAGEPAAGGSAMPDSRWSRLRGFNYQPSYGSNGFELWQKFDAGTIETELERGKRHFPKMEALRWWQSWDSFKRDPERYAANFETTLQLAGKFGLAVMPVLFNRWHDKTLDYGGIYIDHFLPRANWVYDPGAFDAFLETLVGGHKDDPRILAWDLCNEPFCYTMPMEEMIPQIVQSETAWLRGLHDKCRKLGARAPLTIGMAGVSLQILEIVEPLSDVLCVHPYWRPNRHNSKGAYEKGLDAAVAFALKAGKPLLASECCWGSLDDAERAEGVRYTFEQLKKRNIGWLAYLLHFSRIADAHGPEGGPVGGPKDLSFLRADGTLRPGHGVFNEF
jgi:hypothetical protein